MKLVPVLVLVLAAAASGVASAASYSSDQQRREQNREEALSNWRAGQGTSSSRATMAPSRTHGTTRRERLRERTHAGASSVRNFTHRQAEKARHFSARQDRRYGTKRTTINTSPEGGGK